MDSLAAMFANPVAIPVAIGLAAALIAFGLGANKPKRPWRRRSSYRAASDFGRSTNSDEALPVDPTAQLNAVMGADFTKKHVLSLTESRVMAAAERAIEEARKPWRVMAQVALGEVLASSDKAAFYAINAKRVDLLIISEKSIPLAAIEYQGQGHYQGTAPARDAIKKEALRKAGVGYIEITHEHGPDDVRREVLRLAGREGRKAA